VVDLGTLVAVVLSFIGNFIAPIYVEPLFNTYRPLTDAKIRDPILAMAQANQIPVTQVFEVDASRQTTRVSANVSGMLGTTRIALNDNLLNNARFRDPRGHGSRNGHYVLNHGAKLTIYFGSSLSSVFGIANVAFDWALQRGDNAGHPRHCRSGRVSIVDVNFSHVCFLDDAGSQLDHASNEREADQFGINASREPDGEAKVALRLGAYRNSIQRRLKNLFSSIIQAAAPEFKWRWIGRPRIYRPETSTRPNRQPIDLSRPKIVRRKNVRLILRIFV